MDCAKAGAAANTVRATAVLNRHFFFDLITVTDVVLEFCLVTKALMQHSR